MVRSLLSSEQTRSLATNILGRHPGVTQPVLEDTDKDLFLREITERTMMRLEERLNRQIAWVAAEHTDHAPHRHVHVVAVVPGRLQVHDLQALRHAATAACLEQRHQRDLVREQQVREREEAQWEQ